MYINSLRNILRKFYVGPVEILFSIVFTLIFTLGYVLTTYPTIDITPMGSRAILAYFCGALVTWIATLLTLTYVKKWSIRKPKVSKDILLGKISDRKLWLLTAGLIFAFYLPIILLSHSVLSPDSWSSIRQITGDEPLTNAHPVIFTGFAGLFIRIGLLFKSLELGIIIFSLAQSAILAMIFARVIVWMRKEKINIVAIAATLFFYAILPINSIAGIILWKDILFAGFGLLLLIEVRQLYFEKDRYFNNRNVIQFIALAFLFCTWRNNGFYAYAAFSILALVLSRETFFNKRYLVLLFSPIVLFGMYSAATALISKPTSISEGMSVPLQQLARTVKYHDRSIPSEEKNTINQVLPYEKLDEAYNPQLSDPVKSSFDVSTFKKDEGKYIKLWFTLLIKHPKSYIAAFMYNTYGYTYPFYSSSTLTDIVPDNDIHYNAVDGYSDEAYDSGGKKVVAAYRDLIMSIVPFFHNIGFYVCVITLALYIAIIKKRAELIGVFIILLAVFLTTILGPVNGEFRYLYLFVVATPFVIAAAFSNDSLSRSKKKRA